jgi:hypothetical protein
MQKVLVEKRFCGYALGMTTQHPAIPPRFTTTPILKKIDTENKTTQGKAFFNFFAAKDFALHLPYNQVIRYKAGEKVLLEPCQEGFAMLDGYDCHIIDAIETGGVKTNTRIVPADWVTRREFCIVREYKTTTWEIL